MVPRRAGCTSARVVPRSSTSSSSSIATAAGSTSAGSALGKAVVSRDSLSATAEDFAVDGLSKARVSVESAASTRSVDSVDSADPTVSTSGSRAGAGSAGFGLITFGSARPARWKRRLFLGFSSTASALVASSTSWLDTFTELDVFSEFFTASFAEVALPS